MKLVILISVISVIMIAVLTAIIITDERNKRKRIAEVEDDLSFKIWGYLINWKLQDKKSDFFRWMKKESECIEILIRMQDGYTVEKEQLYEVEFYVDEEDDRCLLMKTGKTISFEYESQNEGHYKQQFTEQEIKAIDKRYFEFAVKVDEV